MSRAAEQAGVGLGLGQAWPSFGQGWSRQGGSVGVREGGRKKGKGSQASCKLLLTKIPFKRQRVVPCNTSAPHPRRRPSSALELRPRTPDTPMAASAGWHQARSPPCHPVPRAGQGAALCRHPQRCCTGERKTWRPGPAPGRGGPRTPRTLTPACAGSLPAGLWGRGSLRRIRPPVLAAAPLGLAHSVCVDSWGSLGCCCLPCFLFFLFGFSFFFLFFFCCFAFNFYILGFFLLFCMCVDIFALPGPRRKRPRVHMVPMLYVAAGPMVWW